jgi:CzcA family heavy metal efflux pump
MSLIARIRPRATAVLLLIAILAIAGVFAVGRLPSAIFPSVTFPVVKVIANAGEEPTIEVIPTLTRPLEEALLRVPGIRNVRSITSRGSAELTAQFKWGTDMQAALQRAQAETQRIRPTLPPNTTIDVEWMNTAVFPILGYALTSETITQSELRELAEYTLKPALYRIPGISQVQIQGGFRREFRVELDLLALEGRRLSVMDVVAALKKNNLVLSTGLIEVHHRLYLTVVDGQPHSLADLEKLSVPVKDGVPATVAELGKVTTADEVSYIRTTAGGQPAVLINIIRQPSADTIAISDGINKLFKTSPTLIPKGVSWKIFYDQARFISDSVGGTRDAIVIGVVLAALVLFAFLGSLRLAAIAVLNIPLAAFIVGLGLAVTGDTINLMTLAGIAAALGLIADDAIVVIENIYRHQDTAQSDDPIASGVEEILPALIGSSLSTILIFLPFALLSGVVGAFFKPLALTLALALIVSFGLALILVPIGMSIFGKRDLENTSWLGKRVGAFFMKPAVRRVNDRISQGYARTVRAFICRGWLPVAALLALIGGAYALYRGLATNFLPAMDEGAIILDYWTPPGTSLTDTNQMLDEAEKVIMAIPDVATYSRRTGTQLGFFVTEPNHGDFVIDLKPKSRRRPIALVIDDLRQRIAAVEPAIHTDFGQLLEDNIGDLSGGTPQPIDIKVIGDDVTGIQKQAENIAGLARGIQGAADVFNGIVVSGPTLNVAFDPVAGARYQLTADDLHASLNAAIIGAVVGKIRVKDRTYALRLTASSSGASADSLAQIKVRTPSGALVAVGDVAKILAGGPETEIDRENLKTFVGVTARLSGASLGTVMSEVRRKISASIHLPEGVRIEYGGQYQQQQASFQELFWILLAGLVLVSVVVLFEFGDWRAPVVTSFAAIAVLAGVFLALKLTGGTLNISSYVGAIMMVGIVGENAIFVIHEARLELRRGTAVEDAWIQASHRRLRPVAMTILATGLALAPLALAIGQGSQLIQPLAIGVIGGFVLSGPMVLLVVPGLYRLLDRHGRLAGS